MTTPTQTAADASKATATTLREIGSAMYFWSVDAGGEKAIEPVADGRFDGDEYTVGAFDRADANHDMVWLDGYFIAWPMRQAAK
jgi:hypothetical protein